MKFFIIDTTMKYKATTPLEEPLGGTQSAICYFSLALNQLGHEVYLVNKQETELKNGVKNLQFLNEKNGIETLVSYYQKYTPDIIITQSEILTLLIAKKILPESNTIYWTQHDTNIVKQDIVQNEIDYYFMVSDWQRIQYVEKFKIPLNKTYVLRNCMSHPVNLLTNTPFNKEPTLVYTSAPFRGLHLLVDLIPKLQIQLPELQVKIFSSLKTYQLEENFPALEKLYQNIKKLKNVKFVAGASQMEMAKEIAGAQFMVYPNIFPETSCVAAIEASSLGMEIITSPLGALPETALGHTFLSLETFHTYQNANDYLNLLPIENVSEKDWKQWENEIVNIITDWQEDPKNWEKKKEEQKRFCQKNYSYLFRARNFLQFWEYRKDADKLIAWGNKLMEKKNYWDATNQYFHAMMLKPNVNTLSLWLKSYQVLNSDFIPNKLIYLIPSWIEYLASQKIDNSIIKKWEEDKLNETLNLRAIYYLSTLPGMSLQLLIQEYQTGKNNNNLVSQLASYFTNHSGSYIWSLRFAQFMMSLQKNNYTLYIYSFFHCLMLRDSENGLFYAQKAYQLIFKKPKLGAIFDCLNNTILLLLKNSEDERYFKLLEKSHQLVNIINNNYPIVSIPKRQKLKKIGFVVGDFRFHPVSRLIGIICQYLDSKYEKIIYITQKYDQLFINTLKNTNTIIKIVPSNNLDTEIRKDEIDILIEMMGYTINSDLEYLLKKPAPVILSYFAFPYMTGLNIIDGILTDSYLMKESKLDSSLCPVRYYPLEEVLQTFQPITHYQLDIIKSRKYPIENQPNQRPIIFGSFNNPFKITDSVLKVWCKILNQVPNSKLIFCYSFFKKPETKKVFLQKIEEYGIENKRIEFDYQPFYNFLMKYNEIDIALDPFPYNGGWTTSECLWMSVPLITLEGKSYLARVGGSILSHTGLSELIASSEEDYVNKAVKLANDIDKLKYYHHNIRKIMLNTTHGNPKKFVKQFESTLEKIYLS